MMNWTKLLSPIRFGKENAKPTLPELARSEFQRDYDRLIFSSPFRRLQNKTQVFPLPGSIFVHNRLTHSLEVASIGRSLGDTVSQKIKKEYPRENITLINEIGTIVSSASLAHDMGNPPFGHAGEQAISNFFKNGKGQKYESMVTSNQWKDLTNFEGNANALRLLTHQFNGRREGGFALTYTTIAALIKYPFSSEQITKKGKYGFFESEKQTFKKIAHTLGLKCIDKEKEIYARHPLVYLVEAADDISYLIMDIEDAQKLKILSPQEAQELFLNFFHREKDKVFFEKKEQIFQQVKDTNEQIAFLRASVINLLVQQVATVFMQNQPTILEGKFAGSLVNYLEEKNKTALEKCAQIAFEKIYLHPSVVKIEITGNNVINSLLDEFCQAIFTPNNQYSKKILSLLPLQYRGEYKNNDEKLRAIVDFISGMTDLFAVDLYKLIKGI